MDIFLLNDGVEFLSQILKTSPSQGEVIEPVVKILSVLASREDLRGQLAKHVTLEDMVKVASDSSCIADTINQLDLILGKCTRSNLLHSCIRKLEDSST